MGHDQLAAVDGECAAADHDIADGIAQAGEGPGAGPDLVQSAAAGQGPGEAAGHTAEADGAGAGGADHHGPAAVQRGQRAAGLEVEGGSAADRGAADIGQGGESGPVELTAGQHQIRAAGLTGHRQDSAIHGGVAGEGISIRE